MKQPKRLTRRMKILLTARGLSPEEWALSWEGREAFTVRNKRTGETRLIEKRERDK